MNVIKKPVWTCGSRLAACVRGSAHPPSRHIARTSRRSKLRQAARRKSQVFLRGAVLLEVLIALGLLIFGLAVVGLQVNKGLDAARVAEIGTKGVMLAETKMAELSSGVVRPTDNNGELKGDFGMIYPGYTWHFKFQPTEVNDFLWVKLEIGHSAKQAKMQMDAPDQQIEFEDDNVRVIESVYRLMPIPADVNFERDFGFTKEDFEKAQAQADQAGAGGSAGGDAASAGGSGGKIGGMDMSQILALLGPLLAGGSFDPRMLSSLPSDQLAQLQPILQTMMGRGNVDAKGPLENLLQGGGRGRGGGRGPGRNGNGNGQAGQDGGNSGNDGRNGNNADNNNNNNGSGTGTGRTRTRRGRDDANQGDGNGGNGGNQNNGDGGNGTRRGRSRDQNNNSGNQNGAGSNGSNSNGNGNNSNKNSGGNNGNGSNRRSGRGQGNNTNLNR